MSKLRIVVATCLLGITVFQDGNCTAGDGLVVKMLPRKVIEEEDFGRAYREAGEILDVDLFEYAKTLMEESEMWCQAKIDGIVDRECIPGQIDEIKAAVVKTFRDILEINGEYNSLTNIKKKKLVNDLEHVMRNAEVTFGKNPEDSNVGGKAETRTTDDQGREHCKVVGKELMWVPMRTPTRIRAWYSNPAELYFILMHEGGHMIAETVTLMEEKPSHHTRLFPNREYAAYGDDGVEQVATYFEWCAYDALMLNPELRQELGVNDTEAEIVIAGRRALTAMKAIMEASTVKYFCEKCDGTTFEIPEGMQFPGSNQTPPSWDAVEFDLFDKRIIDGKNPGKVKRNNVMALARRTDTCALLRMIASFMWLGKHDGLDNYSAHIFQDEGAMKRIQGCLNGVRFSRRGQVRTVQFSGKPSPSGRSGVVKPAYKIGNNQVYAEFECAYDDDRNQTIFMPENPKIVSKLSEVSYELLDEIHIKGAITAYQIMMQGGSIYDTILNLVYRKPRITREGLVGWLRNMAKPIHLVTRGAEPQSEWVMEWKRNRKGVVAERDRLAEDHKRETAVRKERAAEKKRREASRAAKRKRREASRPVKGAEGESIVAEGKSSEAIKSIEGTGKEILERYEAEVATSRLAERDELHRMMEQAERESEENMAGMLERKQNEVIGEINNVKGRMREDAEYWKRSIAEEHQRLERMIRRNEEHHNYNIEWEISTQITEPARQTIRNEAVERYQNSEIEEYPDDDMIDTLMKQREAQMSTEDRERIEERKREIRSKWTTLADKEKAEMHNERDEEVRKMTETMIEIEESYNKDISRRQQDEERELESIKREYAKKLEMVREALRREIEQRYSEARGQIERKYREEIENECRKKK
ncbi:MAG: hypothetical protein LBT03_01515 [Holosporales bacterium]|jgi:hypothetical protein|nr:hypothetical protein [Holosporales bacterium]